MASLCHPWFTTTNLSYRFLIFESSATALCGTTGSDDSSAIKKKIIAGKTCRTSEQHSPLSRWSIMRSCFKCLSIIVEVMEEGRVSIGMFHTCYFSLDVHRTKCGWQTLFSVMIPMLRPERLPATRKIFWEANCWRTCVTHKWLEGGWEPPVSVALPFWLKPHSLGGQSLFRRVGWHAQIKKCSQPRVAMAALFGP